MRFISSVFRSAWLTVCRAAQSLFPTNFPLSPTHPGQFLIESDVTCVCQISCHARYSRDSGRSLSKAIVSRKFTPSTVLRGHKGEGPCVVRDWPDRHLTPTWLRSSVSDCVGRRGVHRSISLCAYPDDVRRWWWWRSCSALQAVKHMCCICTCVRCCRPCTEAFFCFVCLFGGWGEVMYHFHCLWLWLWWQSCLGSWQEVWLIGWCDQEFLPSFLQSF